LYDTAIEKIIDPTSVEEIVFDEKKEVLKSEGIKHKGEVKGF
jgi:hypothetical protein